MNDKFIKIKFRDVVKIPWTEISLIFSVFVFLSWAISLTRENNRLKEENTRLLKKTGEYEEMKADAKEILKNSPEIQTIKSLREKYGLSLINAKEIVDSVKEK